MYKYVCIHIHISMCTVCCATSAHTHSAAITYARAADIYL